MSGARGLIDHRLACCPSRSRACRACMHFARLRPKQHVCLTPDHGIAYFTVQVLWMRKHRANPLMGPASGAGELGDAAAPQVRSKVLQASRLLDKFATSRGVEVREVASVDIGEEGVDLEEVLATALARLLLRKEHRERETAMREVCAAICGSWTCCFSYPPTCPTALWTLQAPSRAPPVASIPPKSLHSLPLGCDVGGWMVNIDHGPTPTPTPTPPGCRSG